MNTLLLILIVFILLFLLYSKKEGIENFGDSNNTGIIVGIVLMICLCIGIVILMKMLSMRTKQFKEAKTKQFQQIQQFQKEKERSPDQDRIAAQILNKYASNTDKQNLINNPKYYIVMNFLRNKSSSTFNLKRKDKKEPIPDEPIPDEKQTEEILHIQQAKLGRKQPSERDREISIVVELLKPISEEKDEQTRLNHSFDLIENIATKHSKILTRGHLLNIIFGQIFLDDIQNINVNILFDPNPNLNPDPNPIDNLQTILFRSNIFQYFKNKFKIVLREDNQIQLKLLVQKLILLIFFIIIKYALMTKTRFSEYIHIENVQNTYTYTYTFTKKIKDIIHGIKDKQLENFNLFIKSVINPILNNILDINKQTRNQMIEHIDNVFQSNKNYIPSRLLQ